VRPPSAILKVSAVGLQSSEGRKENQRKPSWKSRFTAASSGQLGGQISSLAEDVAHPLA
jgi:hypothetical protein